MADADFAELGPRLQRCLLCGGRPETLGMREMEPSRADTLLRRADIQMKEDGTAVAYVLCAEHPLNEATYDACDAVLLADRMGTFHITYATGLEFELTGEFRVMEPFPGSGLLVPVVLVDGAPIQALDPRAVVRNAEGVRLFVGCTTAELEDDIASRAAGQVTGGAGKSAVVSSRVSTRVH